MPTHRILRIPPLLASPSSQAVLPARILLFSFILLAGFPPPIARAATFLIRPDGTGDYPSIQDGIDAAADGDTVALTDGEFSGEGNRDLLFRGKRIVVQGQSGDPIRSVIDCGGQSKRTRESHRGFDFGLADTVGALVRDLTIQNGTAEGL